MGDQVDQQHADADCLADHDDVVGREQRAGHDEQEPEHQAQQLVVEGLVAEPLVGVAEPSEDRGLAQPIGSLLALEPPVQA